MGKVKPGSATKNEGQKKISNFFRKASGESKAKALFTEHGQKPSTATCKPSALKTSAVNKPQSSTSHLSSRKPLDPVVIKEEFVDFQTNAHISSDKTVRGQPVITTCIPETQVFCTPPDMKMFVKQNKNDRVLNDRDDNHEEDIIPVTPELKVDTGSRSKRPLGRSFLLSAAEMKANPLQKAKENRETKLALKKMSLARKGLMNISVTFIANNEIDKENGKVGNFSGEEHTIGEVRGNPGNIGQDDVGHTTLLKGKTPIKVYAEGSSLKRMAQEGISPSSKRQTSDGDIGNEKTNSEVGDNAELVKKQLSFNSKLSNLENKCEGLSDAVLKPENEDTVTFTNARTLVEERELKAMQEKAERRQRKLEEKRKQKEQEQIEKERLAKEEKRLKSEKLRKYQLTGSAETSDPSSDVSVRDDDALGAILLELSSPSLLKSSRGSEVDSRNSRQKTSFTKTKSFTVERTAKSKDMSLVGKRDSFDSLARSEWTSKDEEYFCKLGVNTENKISLLRQNSANVEKDSVGRTVCHLLPETLATEHTEQRTGNKDKGLSIRNSGDKQKNESEVGKLSGSSVETTGITKSLEADYHIETFPTPSKSAAKTSVAASQVEIEEFVSQFPVRNLVDLTERCFLSKENSTSEVGQIEAPCKEYGRHVVTSVELQKENHEIVLSLTSIPGDIPRTCVLHGFWLDSHIQVGDTVNVLAEFTDNVCHITDQSGLLVINPDLLLSGTTVVSSVFCMRKSILKEKFKGCDSRNIQMLYGSIIHSVFQQMLKKKLVSAESIIQESGAIVAQPSNLIEMYANSVTEEKVMEEIKSYVPQMVSWLHQFTNFGMQPSKKRPSDCDVVLTEICDIEENMWTPRYGIKGKIDLTVKAKVSDSAEETVLPLELKTGKPSFSVEHKGQVTLYSMMCADRRTDPRQGLLLYLKEPNMKIIPAELLHQRGLIQLRNEMAYYISQQVVSSSDNTSADETGMKTYTLGRLPNPISNLRACQKCAQLINCAIYQRQVEQRSHDSSGMSSLVDETLGHLASGHMTYFIQWCLMLDLESQMDQSRKTVADIWCKSAQQREDGGLCLSAMQWVSDSCVDVGEDTVIVTFCRHQYSQRQTPLSNVGLNAQDSVVISRESPAWVAVCTGFVHSITAYHVQVLMERECVDRLVGLQETTFRIDKCDSFSTAGILYTNMSRLMMDDSQSNKLRRLLIDGVKPEFTNTLSKGNIEKVKAIFKCLNKPQKTAILKVLMCKDYVLIRGYPGTGKTSTIVALVKVLYKLGLSVLLTSYTHSAVDNILLKLHKEEVPFLRIGRVSKVHSEIRPYSVEALTQDFTTTAELQQFFQSQKIVATSCLGINHPVFTQRKFDICIVDEASQVLQPACLGPLFCCHRFVLVGDPKQLPPVVQCKEARELGMDESLFSRLDARGATFDLNVQYRMNSEIMRVSNTLVYDGCLRCGSDSVASQTLDIPLPAMAERIVQSTPWMSHVLDGSLCKSVIVLDTKELGAVHTSVKTGGYRNEKEANIVHDIVNSLCKVGIDSSEIGVIAPYRSQVLYIRDRLGQGNTGLGVEVNTVDQYQGRDKSVILISFVMSSSETKGKVGELLEDVRRLNVAATRAKKKLILIGNTLTLCRYKHLKSVLDLVGRNNVVVLS